jgi:hypothetical protein
MMSARYELWDHATSNCIGAYADEAAALADVRDTVRRYGKAAAASLVLLTAPDDGTGRRVAAGMDLIELAHAAAPSIRKSGD